MRLRSLLLSSLLLAAPRPAMAQPLEEEEGVERSYASPKRYYFEFKLGPYAPNIDSEFGGLATPYKDLFGDGKNVLFGGELDVELFQRFGSLSVGGFLGYYKNGTQAFVDTSSGTSPSGTASRSATETPINLVPMALLAVYRFHVLATRWQVPIVPFAKLGINYTVWWVDSGDGTASYEGKDARGGTFGWQFNAGAALLLDVLEPNAAKTMDVELGINHTYLFFEFSHIAADGFGSSSALRVGDTTWNGGIAFEF